MLNICTNSAQRILYCASVSLKTILGFNERTVQSLHYITNVHTNDRCLQTNVIGSAFSPSERQTISQQDIQKHVKQHQINV